MQIKLIVSLYISIHRDDKYENRISLLGRTKALVYVLFQFKSVKTINEVWIEYQIYSEIETLNKHFFFIL